MSPDSPFYIRRASDIQACGLINQYGGITCTIKGPRQIGKSSLLIRMMREAETLGKQTVLLDFTTFDSNDLSSATSFYKAFVTSIARRLGVEFDVDKYWLRPQNNYGLCTTFLMKYALPHASPGLLLGMDEVDRIADTGFSPDFFAMLRAWHNERAMGLGENLDMVLVTSTEPSLFIPNLNQSPFNVGKIVDLLDFTREEVSRLNRAHGEIVDASTEAAVFDLLHGHPGLTHLALYYISYKILTPEAVLSEENWDSGPFADHLRNFLYRLMENPVLIKAFQQALSGKRCEPLLFQRLSGMGLLAGSSSKPQIRCELYRRYYAEHLRE